MPGLYSGSAATLAGFSHEPECLWIAGVKTGLLGVPDMMVAGGGSSNREWIWYQDRQGKEYVSAGLVSLPMWIWKGLMLIWAFWIASRVIELGKQAWAAASCGGCRVVESDNGAKESFPHAMLR